MNDSFYTPDDIAAYMIGQSTLDSPKSVADFAAGDGILLSHATRRWNNIQVYATDIDEKAVRKLKRKNSGWTISKCDFLSLRSRIQSHVVKAIAQRIDLIALNPPYSCRGGRKYEVVVDGNTIACSKALAFVLISSNYLSSDGQIVAILPQSSFASEKDKQAWELLNEKFVIRKGTTVGRGVFSGCFARCMIVRMSPRKREKSIKTVPARPQVRTRVKLIRGSVPLHIDSGNDRTLVHSTDLINSKVVLNGHVGSKHRPSVIGPSVLLPRVGQPRIEKVALYKRRKRVVLSDCVIGLQCKTLSEASWLHNRIIENGDLYIKQYSGTCAMYTTMKRLIEFLSCLGCEVEM
ncbi:methyltransferase [uncultured Gimesia sp.]|uniref:methyltransferase n=1 Tax=uncultured Gimesia sp. TaxID=1678688 RepID=UPI0030DD6B2A